MTGLRLAAAWRSTAVALQQVVGGLATAFLALGAVVVVIVVALACLVGVGVFAVPLALTALRGVADLERARLSRWGQPVVGAGAPPRTLRSAVVDATTRRELRWLGVHSTAGLLLGVVAVLLPLFAVRDLTFLAWWSLVPDGQATPSVSFWTVRSWSGAWAVALLGLGWVALTVGGGPVLARLQSLPGRWLLAPEAGVDLPLRVAELTATRAAALDAHATELRRIERSLHDGTQNRLVAVTVLVGAARRALVRNPADVDALLERTQLAAEQALRELRDVARTILPPVLADRGLAGALTGLAAACPVPCQVDVDVPRRCAASVEATAYFVVAEALTNIARHSAARHATIDVRLDQSRLLVRVTDDGRGGAEEGSGSGLVGVRSRVEAHDGSLIVTSPRGGPTELEVVLPCGS